MDYFQALVLGLVEGLTEYLPVSSTGHLLLAQRLMGIESSTAADAFAISIQGGAILAVLGLYRARVAQMAMGLFGRDETGRSLLINLVSAFVPAAVLGLLLEKPIKKYLFGGDEWGMWPVVAAWFVGGLAILAVSFARRRRGARGTRMVSRAAAAGRVSGRSRLKCRPRLSRRASAQVIVSSATWHRLRSSMRSLVTRKLL